MFEEIDALPDAKPSTQFVKRVRGEKKEQAPPATKTLQGRARRWMIDPKWLEEHSEFDLPARIADNGKLWGDSRDPEATEALIKQSAKEKADLKLKRKQRLSDTTLVANSDEEGGSSKKKRKKGKGKGKDKGKVPKSSQVVEGDDDDDDLYA